MDFPVQAIIFGLWKTLNVSYLDDLVFTEVLSVDDVFCYYRSRLVVCRLRFLSYISVGFLSQLEKCCLTNCYVLSLFKMIHCMSWRICHLSSYTKCISPVKIWIKQRGTTWTKSLCVLIMLHTHFRLNLHSVVAWI